MIINAYSTYITCMGPNNNLPVLVSPKQTGRSGGGLVPKDRLQWTAHG